MSPVRTAPASLTSRETALRTAYLTEVMRILYPPPCVTGPIDLPPEGVPVAQFHVVPDMHRARLLVPAGVPRVAAAVLRGANHRGPSISRLKRAAAAVALRTGLAGLVMPDRIQVTRDPRTGPPDTIESYLGQVLGRELLVAVHVGPARPSRKPLLQLLTPEGYTLGYAKLGVNALTARLVRLEASALTALGHVTPKDLITPMVLHSGQWRGHEVLVQAALPVRSPGRRGRLQRSVPPERLAAAQCELAFAMGTVRGSLAASGYWRVLRERVETIAAQATARADAGVRDDARSLALAGDMLVAGAGDVELTYGAWHGDWTPWNMAVHEYGVLLWDWDRFGTGVPVGFDAMHYDLHERMRHTEDAAAEVRALLDRAPLLLAPFRVTDPDAARLTALLYLVDLATRYLDDKRSGGRLGVLGTWLLPELLSAVEER